ncbi:MAG: acetyl-CoA C-acetyltransferase [Synergistaceae bacterium]|nr:acetyl-CoA C-acetyltransferase [Synergistaceae bacterium]
MKREVVLTGATRTAIGKYGGSLSSVSAAKLGAIVIEEALSRAGVAPSEVDEVFMGCILQSAQGQNVGRQSAVMAGIPVEKPALTLNNVCGSGLKCVNLAAIQIAAGEADVIVAGGVENMSGAPYALSKARFGYRMNDGEIVDVMVRDALWDAFNNCHMGMTAENVAEKFGVTREAQDAFAAESQRKCEAARRANKFADEIVAVPLKTRGEPELFKDDEFPRDGVTVESLAKLKPSFKQGGTVTAGNASGINDGAAALIVMSAEKAEKLGIRPMARFSTGASAGVDPAIMGIGPVYSTRKALEKAGLSLADIDLIEANEAFAAQSEAVGKLLEWDRAKVNVNGGAIALGHPVGAAGARILVTLLHEMRRRAARYGLATLCVGGGMGVSAIVENLGG